jgi:hypothetical protein
VKRARLLPLALALACEPVEIPDDLAAAPVQRAWLEEYDWTALGVVGGGITGGAWLYVEEPDGTLHEQYVRLRGGLAGFGLEISPSGGRSVVLDLPPEPLVGADLFERYRGSLEGFVVGFGFSSLHLHNDAGVQLDDQGLGFLLCVTVSAAWLQLVPAEPPPLPETGDSAPGDETGDR